MGHRPGALRITVIDDPPGIAIAGDVDAVTIAEFSEAVSAAVGQFPGDLHIDLADIGFIDLEGLRILVRASRTLAAEGRKLVLVSAPPYVREVLRVVGWSESFTASGNSEDDA